MTRYFRGSHTVEKACIIRMLPCRPESRTPVTPSTRPEMVQMTNVSKNTSVTPVMPCSTGCCTFAAEWMTGADPSPASLE